MYVRRRATAWATLAQNYSFSSLSLSKQWEGMKVFPRSYPDRVRQEDFLMIIITLMTSELYTE